MNTESNKVLLLGIGETGLQVTQILGRNKVKGITTLGIDEESQLKLLYTHKIQETELVILVADLGSKKEGILTLQAAKLAKENGKIVASFITIPRIFEGEKKIMRALETAMELKSEVDASLIINKENFTNLPEDGYSPAELVDSLLAVENRIADAIQNMMALISGHGGVNIDLDDLKSALALGGTFAIDSGFGIGEDRISDAIDMVLSSPMMKTCDIFTSRKVLIRILTPEKSPGIIRYAKIISEFIKKFPQHVDVTLGVGRLDDYDLSLFMILSELVYQLPTPVDVNLGERKADDDLSIVTILATGFDVKLTEK